MVLRQRVTLRIFARGQHEILVAHDLGDGRGDLGNDGPLKALQIGFFGRVIQDVFAEFADRHALDGAERFLVERIKDQAGDVVVGRVDQRLADDFSEGEIRQSALGGHAFALGARSQSRQLVAGLLFIGLGK